MCASAARAPSAPPALAFVVTQYDRMPAAYRSEECRDEGELDLRPETAVWP